MDKEKLMILFDKIYDKEIEVSRKNKIIDKVIMYEKYIELSPISLLNVIENFIKIEKLGFIDKIDDNLFVFLKKILCKKRKGKINEVDAIYFLDYISYLIIPYNVIKCENEYDLPKFLGEFEILVSCIEDDDSFLDMEKLRLYNEELFNIISFRMKWIMKNINKDFFKEGSIQDQLITETTLAHLMSIFYFSLDKYENNFDILKESYDIVLDNYNRLKEYCRENRLYNDMFFLNFISNINILKEYEFCRDILDDLNEKSNKKVN